MKIVSIFGLFLVSVNAAPPPVSNVQIDSVGIDFFVVKWDQYNNTVSGFQVEYSIIPQTAASIRDTEDNSKNFFNVTNLFSGTSYQVRVRPIGGFNETVISNNETEYGQWSVYVACVTEGPLPPTSLSITNIIDTKVNLKWTPSLSKVDSYQLFIRNSKSLQVTNQYVVSSDVYEIEVEMLTPSTPYSVFINALLNNLRSSYLTGGFQTNISPPEAPNNLSVSNILETSAELSWVDPQNGQDIVSYMIELSEMSSNENTSVFLSNSVNYVVIGLKIATNYTFRVRSVSVMSDIISEWSSVVGFKTLIAALPPPPRFVSITNVSKESALITWETPTTLYPINSYNIVYNIIGMQPMSQKVPGDVNSYTLMNLVSGTQYSVAIQAVVLNDVFGEFSVDNIFVTAGPKPVSITISAISDSSANVSWNVSSVDYSSSIVILFDNSIKVINTTKLFTKNVSWYTFTNLAPNNPYIIKIFVKDENNISSSEASNGFRTKLEPDVLNAPTNTSVSILSPSSVLFQCNTVSLAVAYEIRIEGNPNPRVPLYRTDQFSAFLDSSLIQKMQIKDLVSGYTYFLSVRAIFGDIYYVGQWSPVVPIVLYGGRPPSQIQITNINENSAIVRWTQAYDRLTLSRLNIKYFIRLEDADGKSNLINFTFAIPQGNYGKFLSFKFPNSLVSNSNYKVSIFCEKDNINGTANVTTFKTSMVSIAKPYDLVIFNNDTSAKIKWNVINMNDILYYVVELYTSESGSLYFRTDGSSPSLDIYSLFPNTYYQFRVHAVGTQDNVGEWSAWESVVTQSKMEVSKVHSINHSNRSNSGVIIGVTIGVVGIVLIFAYVVRTLWKKKYKPTKFKQFENSVKYSKNSLKEQINVQRTSS